ncbi:MAG: gamma-glutamyl-gamma-aminobutyrate hydrolase family protein [Deltaproteobacteria bacterium]|jgi:putative glutamine amidotransferase|nr:gamma-glutamyl-gamma-aminobutyrate hydrolase family protein [Deltaproteobacteria bacterium]
MLLGVTQRMTLFEKTGEFRDCLAHDWYKFLRALEMPWLTLPNDPCAIIEYVVEHNVTGLIFSGGDDIGSFPIRDETEKLLLRWSFENALPVIGVCRGFQAINHWLNGELRTLNSDIHIAKRHKIVLSDDTTREVNSFHKYSPVKNDDLTVLAYCPIDDSIEAAYHKSMLGVMWHPEREQTPVQADIDLFKSHLLGYDA